MQPWSRFIKMATLIKVLGVANRIILKWHRFGSTQGLTLPHEPSEDVPPPSHPFSGAAATVVDSWVLELAVDWQARRGHHAPRHVRGGSCHCEILFHCCGVWHVIHLFEVCVCECLCFFIFSIIFFAKSWFEEPIVLLSSYHFCIVPYAVKG